MRMILALTALATLAAGASQAQPYAPPAGSYQRQCGNIRMEGQFLHANCRGAQSSINVMSCSTDIGVGPDGGLVCGGPGAPAASVRGYNEAPGYNAAPGYNGAQGYDDRRGYRGQRYGRETATLFSGRNSRGRSVVIEGDTPNLDDIGINDRVRSIQIPRRSGAWQICTDANYRGRCETITTSVGDVRRLGLDGISSLRPIRDDGRYDRRY